MLEALARGHSLSHAKVGPADLAQDRSLSEPASPMIGSIVITQQQSPSQHSHQAAKPIYRKKAPRILRLQNACLQSAYHKHVPATIGSATLSIRCLHSSSHEASPRLSLTRKQAPGTSLLQDSFLQTDDVPFPAHTTTEGFPLQPTEAGPCHAHLTPPHSGVEVEAEADLLNFSSQGC